MTQYNYKSVNEIDANTLDYLEFVVPRPVGEMSIGDINKFLNKIEQCYDELAECG